jgi:hypothetical protein
MSSTRMRFSVQTAGAPPPAAAAALTPPAHRSVGFASARSGTERGGRTRSAQCVAARISFLPSCNHGVEDDDQLAHAGDDGNLGLFSFGKQTLIVGGYGRPRQAAEVAAPAGDPLQELFEEIDALNRKRIYKQVPDEPA